MGEPTHLSMSSMRELVDSLEQGTGGAHQAGERFRSSTSCESRSKSLQKWVLFASTGFQGSVRGRWGGGVGAITGKSVLALPALPPSHARYLDSASAVRVGNDA